jgi:hypothetical protein
LKAKVGPKPKDSEPGRTEQRIVLEDRFQVELVLEDLVVRFERLEVFYAWFLHASTQIEPCQPWYHVIIVIPIASDLVNLGNLTHLPPDIVDQPDPSIIIQSQPLPFLLNVIPVHSIIMFQAFLWGI